MHWFLAIMQDLINKRFLSAADIDVVDPEQLIAYSKH